jgi:predicted phage-related endonuclease
VKRYDKIKDFHASRRLGVGASDIPILAGLTKKYNSTPLTLWRQKVGLDEPWEGNANTYWGKKEECLILHEFISQRISEEMADDFLPYYMRQKSYMGNYSYTEAHRKDKPFCFAHADLVTEHYPCEITKEIDGEIIIEPSFEEVIVEAKTTGAMAGKRRKGQIFTGYDPDDLSYQGIPDAVYLQVQWQLFCYHIKKAFVAVKIDQGDFRIYGPIIEDLKTQQNCLALAERFWRLVENKTPPSPETWNDIQILWPDQNDTSAMIGGDDEIRVKKMIQKYGRISERIKELNEEKEDIKNAVGILIGENEVLRSASGDDLAKSYKKEKYTISYKNALKAAPDIVKKLEDDGLIKKSEWREIRLKGEK